MLKRLLLGSGLIALGIAVHYPVCIHPIAIVSFLSALYVLFGLHENIDVPFDIPIPEKKLPQWMFRSMRKNVIDAQSPNLVLTETRAP